MRVIDRNELHIGVHHGGDESDVSETYRERGLDAQMRSLSGASAFDYNFRHIDIAT